MAATRTAAAKAGAKPPAGKAPANKAAATTRTRRAAVEASPVTHDQIAHRAYELHRAGHGDELANWLQAEHELLGTAR